jgi:hypothetical protein
MLRRVQPSSPGWWIVVVLAMACACDADKPDHPEALDAARPVGRDATVLDAGPPTSATLRVRVTDPESKQPIACKVTFRSSVTTGTPYLGMSDGVGEWLGPNVLGVRDTLYGDPCDFSVPLPIAPIAPTAAGTMHFIVSQGIEREVAERDLELKSGQTATLEVELPRAIDTRGYACADFHVHSAPSFDSDVPLDQRLISAVADGLDALAPTDHDVVVDWNAELARANMQGRLTLILGDEVTADSWANAPQSLGHFAVFPVPLTMDASSYQLQWDTVGSLLARLDQTFPDSLIQVNHPRWDATIGFLTANAFNPLDPTIGERLGLSHLNAIEVWNTHEIDGLGGIGLEGVLQDYFKLIDLGFRLVATGNTDTHELSRQPLGYPRNCIRVADDSAGGLTADAVLEGLGAGHSIVTSGPWLEVSLAGKGPGETVTRPQSPELEILVDGASWVPIDHVLVFVNGAMVDSVAVPEVPMRLKVPLSLPEGSSYVMVMVQGDEPLPVNAGVPNQPLRSTAFSNPIWVVPP